MARKKTTPAAEAFSPLVLLPMAVPFAIIGVAMLVWLVFVGYGMVGAVMSLQGREFRLPADRQPTGGVPEGLSGTEWAPFPDHSHGDH